MTCPFCKIDFAANPWAYCSRRVVCSNCRHYHDAVRMQQGEKDEAELFKVFASIPVDWRTRTDNWRAWWPKR